MSNFNDENNVQNQYNNYVNNPTNVKVNYNIPNNYQNTNYPNYNSNSINQNNGFYTNNGHIKQNNNNYNNQANYNISNNQNNVNSRRPYVNEPNNPNYARNTDIYKGFNINATNNASSYSATFGSPNIFYNSSTLDSVINNANGITTYVTSNKKREDVYNLNKKMNSKKYKIVQSLNNSKRLILTVSLSAIIILIASYFVISYATTEPIAVASEPITFETNSNVLNMNQIITSNMNINTFKETVNEQRIVQCPIVYVPNDKLPEGEEQIKTDGVDGSSKVIAVRTYEDNEVIDETIISQQAIVEPIAQEIYIGTSKFLKQYEVHINDLMYTLIDTPLYSKPDITSTQVSSVPSTYDVTLLDLSGDFCKVKYESVEGYIPNAALTSAARAPEIVEKARLRRIINNVNIDMELNKKSGLALSDFKKICSDNPSDVNKIFEQNYEAFYNVEQKYNVNGVFLIALAIHESGWGTSQICMDKKNLFGYGSYDSDPYNMSYTFDTYEEGIELVAKVLSKSYLNPKDTVIYDNETATGIYYNESTVKGVNTRYSTDSSWHTKVFNYMVTLYNKLDSTKEIQVSADATISKTSSTTESSSSSTTTSTTNTTTENTTTTTTTNTTNTTNNTIVSTNTTANNTTN